MPRHLTGLGYVGYVVLAGCVLGVVAVSGVAKKSFKALWRRSRKYGTILPDDGARRKEGEKMAKQVKIAIMSFGRGMAEFVRPWGVVRRSCTVRTEPPRGIGRHFAAVGDRLWRAVDQFEREHPEVVCHAV